MNMVIILCNCFFHLCTECAYFCYIGELVQPGYIIVKQRGTAFCPGSNVGSCDQLIASNQ